MKMICEGCEEEFINIIDQHPICTPCVRARHKAVLARKCVCRSKKHTKECNNGMGRRWLSCLRCLGTVKQLS